MSTTAVATMTTLLEEYDALAGNAAGQSTVAHRVVQHVKTTRAETLEERGPVMRPGGRNKYAFNCMTCERDFAPGHKCVWIGEGPTRNVYQCDGCHSKA